MDQPDGAYGVDTLDESVELKTNDFPLDLTKATIYKYTIKFSMEKISTTDKKFLASKFLDQLKVNRKSECFIYGNNFEFMLPRLESDLVKKALQAVFVREIETVNGAAAPSASSYCANLRSRFLASVLITRANGSLPKVEISSPKEAGLQLCTVYADMATFDLKSFESRLGGSEANESVRQERQEVLDALDRILLREARDTGSVQVHGRRIFDMAGVPIAIDKGVELRRGLVAETCIVNASVVRRITPCTGLFHQELNLAELLELHRPLENDAQGPLDIDQVNKLLTGLRVKKTYGKREVVQILGVMAGNPDQETFYWNNHKTTTVSHYMEKVYPASKISDCPSQNCILVRSTKHQEVLPTSLCSVLPGQYLSKPAGAYLSNAEKGWQRRLAENISKCVCGMDGNLTKLLKCSTSPTVAGQYSLKIPGYGEPSALRARLSDHSDRMVKGTILERHITSDKTVPKLSRHVLVLVFSSADLEGLKDLFGRGLRGHIESGATSQVSTYDIQKVCNKNIGQLIEDARTEIPKGEFDADHLRPTVIGIFRKPQGLGKPGQTALQDLDLLKLRRTYQAIKRYCQEEGYPFVGTFLHQTFTPQDDNKLKPVMLNTVHRLRTQVRSAAPPASLTASVGSSPKKLLLGIHVSGLQPKHTEQPAAGAQSIAGWYLISIVAKWSGSSAFHRARTFLQKICNPAENRPHTLPSVLAMANKVEKSIGELFNAASLAGSSIIVFRAGVPSGALQPEQARVKTAETPANKAARNSRAESPLPAAVTGWQEAAAKNVLVENRMPVSRNPEDAEMTDSSRSTTENDSFRDDSVKISTTEGTSPERGFSERGSKSDSPTNPEIGALMSFAKAQNARLAYVEVASRTRARIFGPGGESLFDPLTGAVTDKKGVEEEIRYVSSIMAPTPTAALQSSIIDCLIQKKLSKKAGPNTPVQLKLRSIDEEMIRDRSLIDALSEASWDFPAGTWSSKNLSCVTLARKANRHAMRVVQFDANGDPWLPKIHADLKDSLYFI